MERILINLGCTAMLAGLYLWGMRKHSRIEKIIVGSGFFAAGCFMDRLCGQVMEGIMREDWNRAQLLGLILSKSMAGIFLLLFCAMNRECRDTETDRSMSYVEKMTVAGTVFFWCMLIAAGLFFDGKIWIRPESSFGKGRILAADFFWTLMLFTVLLGFYLSVYIHMRAERCRQEERNRQEEHRKTEAYLCTIENNYQRIRELWHDLRNHVSLLNLLLQEEKYGQMRDYLKVFGEEVDQVALPVKSGNLIVDAVLTDKAARARQENIHIKIELCDLTELKLKPDEICSLLGNLLDNAIEACSRVESEKRILVVCRTREKDFYLSVRNSLPQEPAQGDVRVSRKKDRENVVGHGLGLRSVERVVNRHAGEFVTEVENGMFTAAVWLPGES